MQEKELYFLRHGDTGLQGRYIGATDAPLTRQGREQVRKTGMVLRQKGIARIQCSPLLRCRQTMTELNLPAACNFNDLLREIDFGRWEGKNFAEIVQCDQDLVDAWVADPHRFTFPDGESLISFTDRIAAFKTELEQMGEDTLLVVAHGGVIRHLLCQLLRLPAEKYLVFDIRPGCFCSIRLYPEGGVLTGFNIKG
ncbi:histidine phosphatase family protein [Desulfopila sp. IMCC35006]|uniref:histidine phosphatase family protein n=1 Tax=Desulfopila sp. IMCC35006 TaxID=2569542 RepID=UPI0010ACEDBB|nr:histidine phosphatase family protein [Desulfopila sp. IMCC35006]TKB27412.1 histidine phosphatase family protein [Desulfopila sp. IMCC35006]